MIVIIGILLHLVFVGVVAGNTEGTTRGTTTVDQVSTNEATVVTESGTTATTEKSTTTIQGAPITMTSTSALKVSSDSSTSPPISVKHSFFVAENGNICIMLKKDSRIYLEGRHGKDDGNKNITDDTDVGGSCSSGENQQRLTFSWSNAKLDITFVKNSEKLLWYVSSVKWSSQAGTTDPGNKLEVISDEKDVYLETPLNMSYSCKERQVIPLCKKCGVDNLTLVIESIQIQAFVPNDDVYGKEFLCGSKVLKDILETPVPEVVYRSDTVPVAVGSCLAVVTVLIIAGYAIYRSLTFKKVDYATMDD